MKPFFTYPRSLMPVAIEAKIKIDDAAAVAATVSNAGGLPIGEFDETHTFYDTDDRNLLAADEALILTTATDLATGAVAHQLTHRGPGGHGALKRRDETELSIGSIDEGARLLDRLGYSRCFSFQKRRHALKLDGCAVQIEEIPHLGTYVRILAPTEDALKPILQLLGLADRPFVKASYFSMLSSHLQERGDLASDIRFPSQPRIAKAG